MANLFNIGETVRLGLQLSDGAIDQYPRAFIYQGGILAAAVALTHVAQGFYQGLWVPEGEAQYDVLYIVYADSPRTVVNLSYDYSSEAWQHAGVVSGDVAAAVWNEALSEHEVAGSVGEALVRAVMTDKIMRNRLELTDGSINNWVLYDDDSITPLLRWSVRDKDGDAIQMNKWVPARRTRGE
jgi:hypothetical protein